MREQFADKYNVVTVQCEYFGSKFIQTAETFNLKHGIDSLDTVLSEDEIQQIINNSASLMEIISNYSITLPVEEVLREKKKNL